MKVSSKIFRVLAVGALAAALNMVGGGAAQAAQVTAPVKPADGRLFNPIKNVGNGKCLQPADESSAEFAAIVQVTCDTNAGAQLWWHEQVGTNHYRFKSYISGFCFDAFDGAFNGARLLQGTCVPISNEEFNTNTALPEVVILESRVGFRDTGFCIDVPGAQAIEGLAMQIWRCNGTLAQRWVVGFSAFG